MPRAAATNRLRIRDFVSSLLFDGATSTVVIPHNANQLLTTGLTLSAWIKPRSIGENSNGHIIAKSTGTSGQGGYAFRVRDVNKLGFIVNAGTDVVSAAGSLVLNVWQHVLVTVASDATVTHYINGSASGTPATTGALSGITTTNDLTIGNRSGATDRTFDGWIDEPIVWNRVLTAQEISDLYLLGTIPTSGLVDGYLFNEGAGTTVNSFSASPTNGTITAATFSADVPMKARKQINGNKVKNGDFEYAPPFTAITTTSARFIDGSAGGSTTNDLFGWYLINGAGTFGASFDTSTKFTGTASLKLEATDATGRGRALSAPFESTTTIALINTYGIPAQPSTDYILTAYVKTAGASASSVRIQALFFTADGAQSGSSNSSFQGATQDFTLVSLPFTTASTTRFIVIKLDDNTSPGAAHQAWFDDVKLLPVYPEGRVPANGNLVKNFDFEVAPTFVAAQATSARWIDGTSAGSTTNSTYKWAFAQETGTGLVQYDSSTAHLGTYSMKLSTTATGSLVQVAPVLSTNAADVVISGIRATPSTDYTLTFWMKTNYVSGDSNDGAYILVSFSDSFGTGLSSASSTKIKTTTDWTQYTLNFTTTSLTQIIYPRLRIEGSTGTGTLIMDAWFDDIYLAKTTNPGRIQIT